MATTRIIGSYISPYVRKVLVALNLKGISYEIDPISPFMGSDEFSKLSPIRRIPVLIDDEVSIADSTVICEYLEDRYPKPRLYPKGRIACARARWLEEFADTRMGDVFIWQYFYQLAIRTAIWGEKPDSQVVEASLKIHIPQVLDYLEQEVPADGFLFGGIMIADVAIASFFRNASLIDYQIDQHKWPITSAYVGRVSAVAEMRSLEVFEDCSISNPPDRRRNALKAIGAPISNVTLGNRNVRRGIMPIE